MVENRRGLGSDLAKVDAYENTGADYAEIAELDDDFFNKAKLEVNGKPIDRRSSKDRPEPPAAQGIDVDVVDAPRGEQ